MTREQSCPPSLPLLRGQQEQPKAPPAFPGSRIQPGTNSFPKIALDRGQLQNLGPRESRTLEEPGKSSLFPWEELIFKALAVPFEMHPTVGSMPITFPWLTRLCSKEHRRSSAPGAPAPQGTSSPISRGAGMLFGSSGAAVEQPWARLGVGCVIGDIEGTQQWRG